MALQVLLWLGVALVVLVVLFLILPVRIVLTWQSDPVRRTTVLLRPFGGVSPSLPVFDSTRKRKPKPKPKSAARKTPKQRRTPGRISGNVLSEAVMLLRRVVGAIHFESVHLDAEFGLGDPAETGQLFGQLCPIIYGAGANLHLRPNFGRACFEGEAAARLRVTPAAVAWPFVGFGWRVFGPGR